MPRWGQTYRKDRQLEFVKMRPGIVEGRHKHSREKHSRLIPAAWINENHSPFCNAVPFVKAHPNAPAEHGASHSEIASDNACGC